MATLVGAVACQAASPVTDPGEAPSSWVGNGSLTQDADCIIFREALDIASTATLENYEDVVAEIEPLADNVQDELIWRNVDRLPEIIELHVELTDEGDEESFHTLFKGTLASFEFGYSNRCEPIEPLDLG
jgi:hypothetical protein